MGPNRRYHREVHCSGRICLVGAHVELRHPLQAKQYIDIITQPGLLFGFDPEAGYSGLLENKVARVFYSAGVYAPGAPAKYGEDFHSTYLTWWLNFIGVSEIRDARFQPSLLTADPAGDQKAAVQRSAELAH